MKILMLCDFYDESLEYQENLLVKYYRKHGHQVTVVTSTFDSVFDYYQDRHDPGKPARTYFDHGAKIVKLRYRYNLLNRLRASVPRSCTAPSRNTRPHSPPRHHLRHPSVSRISISTRSVR